MEADRDGNSAGHLEYIECTWGDLIYGSKEQLQALGLGLGAAFPGEAGAKPRKLIASDQRGLKTIVKLEAWRGPDMFSASIVFPGRDGYPRRGGPQAYAPGVTRCEAASFDEYVGTSEALAAAGLARIDQFPGEPGMRKVRVRIFPDGTMPTGPRTVNHQESRQAGSKSVERATKTTFRVRVVIAAEQADARKQAHCKAYREWERRMAALPRPARLDEGLFNSLSNISSAKRTLPPGWSVIVTRRFA